MYQLFASIIVCQIVYCILIAVAKCLRFKKHKSRENSSEMATNMPTEENSYILTGIEGLTVNSDNIRKQIDAAFDTQKIQATVRSVYIGFTSQEVGGLDAFHSEFLLGFVRVTGVDVKKLGMIKVTNTMTLHSLPEDVFGQTEAKLQQHVAVMIPSLREKLVRLCQKLGIKITKETKSIWLVGDPLPINIAQSYFKQQCCEISAEFTFGPESSDHKNKIEKLQHKFSLKGQLNLADGQFGNDSTAYLSLAFFLGKAPSLPSDKVVFVAPRKSCTDSDLIFKDQTTLRSMIFSSQPVNQYVSTLKETLRKLTKTHQPVYLTDPMPSDFRNILETVVEEMLKPTLFMKCQKRHWSCYMFPTDKAQAAQQYVDNYLRVNTYKETWWSELPEEILTTRELQLPESDTRDNAAGVKTKGIVEKEAGHSTRLSEACTIDVKNKKPPISVKPSDVKYKYVLPVKLGKQEVQFLYATHAKEIQDMEAEHKVKLTVETESLHITADTEVVANVVEEKLTKMLNLANFHTITFKNIMPSETTATGVLILKCMKGTSVSATGPRELVEALDMTFRMRNKKVDTKETQTDKKPVKYEPGAEVVEDEPSSIPLGKGQNPHSETHCSSMIGAISKKPLHTNIKTENNEDKDKHPPSTPTGDALPMFGGISKKRGLKTNKTKITSNTKPTGTEGMKTFENLKTRVLVKIGQSDITKLEVDAIVNAANYDLEHIGGIARAIAVAAGPGFDDECQEVLRQRRKKLRTGDVCVTGAGKMPAKKVLHAVGPAADEYDEESVAFDVLRDTFSNCLIEAQNENCQSVAIPAISSGNFGIPMEKVAEMATQALENFLGSDKTSPVHLVIFTDIRAEMIQLFEKAMKKLVKKNVLKLV